MDVAGYLEKISAVYASGAATEHSYRPALADLFRSIDATAEVINEPKRSEGGMPDFLFQRDGVAFGWAEAKDLPKDVVKLKGYSVEQRKRYENAYPNLIYTNGVDFEFIRDRQVAYSVSIAGFMGELGGLQPIPENFPRLESLLKDFATQKPVSIKSAQKLAELMAGKAQIIKGETEDELKVDPEFRSALGRQFTTFKDNLLPNLTPGEFADIYAETITYGMFAARLHDDTLDTFSRAEALEKLPKSNPFLRGLFQYIAGYDIPDRLRRVVDDLAEVLRASDPHSLFADFGKFTARNDPFIHFYETFLAAYNPKKRKARGVWYTPEPVVDFIVRAVDDVLKTEFGIEDGLADHTKVTVDWDTGLNHPKTGKPLTEKREVHRVQILDPATGTGTFLAKTVQMIADRVKARAPGKWSSYVEEDLLPRLHGFELLMASYAMCHMKLDMQLTESGYTPSKNAPRLSVWLTNALEPAEREVKDLFFQQLADEARGASEVKRQTPIMCVIGNPPYSISSSNQSEWITTITDEYKEGLNEQNVQALSDDYIKFLRFAQHLVQKNQKGLVGFITNNAYIDGLIQSRMRHSLVQSFDKIIITDLHGSTKRRERSPDGSPDKNIFDIQQGVSIVLLVRTHGGPTCTVMHRDLFGSRAFKNNALFSASIQDPAFQEISPRAPAYYLVPKNFSSEADYNDGFLLIELFKERATGTKFRKDPILISENFDPLDVHEVIEAMVSKPASEITSRWGFNETKDWVIEEQRENFRCARSEDIRPVIYRPFDIHYAFYPLSRIHKIIPRGDSRRGLMRHLIANQNFALVIGRQGQVTGNEAWNLCYSSEEIVDQNVFYRGGGLTAPLYLYPDTEAAQTDALAPTERTLNLDSKLFAQICKAAGIDPADTAGPEDDFRAPTGDARPSEVKVFDYIYGVLHSPDYRETFAEFLKIDFPRAPYPASPEVFKHVSEKGEALRRLHLMESPAIGETASRFMGEHEDSDEDSVVASGYPKREDGHVWINKHQYFENVPETAWNFYIGGYQPAQKWLKDRKGRVLSLDDITHYQKIVKILLETDRIMREINLPLAVGE